MGNRLSAHPSSSISSLPTTFPIIQHHTTLPPDRPAALAIPDRKPTPLIIRTMVRHGWHACCRIDIGPSHL
jgi:hypothetical protein